MPFAIAAWPVHKHFYKYIETKSSFVTGDDMKLRHADSTAIRTGNKDRKAIFSRMKDRINAAAIVGAALLLPAAAGCKENHAVQQPALVEVARQPPEAGSQAEGPGPSQEGETALALKAPFAFETTIPRSLPQDALCRGFPEIDSWAEKRGIDRFYVRALAYTQSGFDPLAAAKVCRAGYDAQGCFSPGPGKDEGYDAGHDEMYDPAGKAVLPVAPNSNSAQPDWRWLGLGLMQTVEPPYTFWPSSHSPDGRDGPYYPVFLRSGFGNGLGLNMARSCNPKFNPFNANDSACLGTAKVGVMLGIARAWIASHRAMLNWGSGDRASDELFAHYIAGHMYSGYWGARNRSQEHPRCSSATANSECWAYGFSQSAAVSSDYCASGEGQLDAARCTNGQPIRNPPETCYGYGDFVTFVRDCELPYLTRQTDSASSLMSTYLWLRNRCPQ